MIVIVDTFMGLLPKEYQVTSLIGMHVPGLDVLFTVLILILTGMLVTFFGNKFVDTIEKAFNRIPLFRNIYFSAKHVTHTLFKSSSGSFRKVVMFEYPRQGIWTIGFVTSESFYHPHINSETYTIFLPVTPPTAGTLLIIPKKNCIEMSMSVEDALKMIVSLGVVSPIN